MASEKNNILASVLGNKQTNKTQTQNPKPTNPEILRILQQVYREMLSSGDQDQVLCGVGWSAHSAAPSSWLCGHKPACIKQFRVIDCLSALDHIKSVNLLQIFLAEVFCASSILPETGGFGQIAA